MPTRSEQVEKAARALHPEASSEGSLLWRLHEALALPDDAPKWSSEVPKVAGWHWLRRPGSGIPSERKGKIVYAFGDGIDQLSDADEWQGPLPEPVGE